MLRVAERLTQRGERFRLAVIAVDVAHELREARVGVFVDAVLAAVEAVANSLAQSLDARSAARDADHGNVELAVLHEALERRKNLLVREVARDAEDHERIRLFPGHGVLYRLGAPGRSTWPPNSWRIADSNRFAKSSWLRELKRANNAVARTGTGTPASTAVLTVQRPSPESATSPRNPSSVGLRASAALVRSSSQERTTLPCRHSSAMAARSKSYCRCALCTVCGAVSASACAARAPAFASLSRLKPSAYAAMSPYSMPLCSILTSLPSSLGPQCK